MSSKPNHLSGRFLSQHGKIHPLTDYLQIAQHACHIPKKFLHYNVTESNIYFYTEDSLRQKYEIDDPVPNQATYKAAIDDSLIMTWYKVYEADGQCYYYPTNKVKVVCPFSLLISKYNDTSNQSITTKAQLLHIDLQPIAITLSPVFSYQLYKESESGKMTLTNNGRLLYGRRLSNIIGSMQHDIYPFSRKFSWIKSRVDYLAQVSFEKIMLSRSPIRSLTKQIPEYFLTTLYFYNELHLIFTMLNINFLTGDEIKYQQKTVRRRVLYYIKKGNTQKAVSSLFHGHKFPKSIRNLLIQGGFIDQQTCEYIAQSIKQAGVDKTYQVIHLIHDLKHLNDYNRMAIMGLYTFIMLLFFKMGFSYEKLKHTANAYAKVYGKACHGNTINANLQDNTDFYDYIQFLIDIANMYWKLKHDDKFNSFLMKPPRINTVLEYHDYLTSLINIQAQERLEAMSMPHVSEFKPYSLSNNDYLIRPVHNSAELVRIGTYMRHCVASYLDNHHDGHCEIMVVVPTDNDTDYKVCIELIFREYSTNRHYWIRQAKMTNNRQVRNEPELNNFVLAWAKDHKISLAECSDVTTNVTY